MLTSGSQIEPPEEEQLMDEHADDKEDENREPRKLVRDSGLRWLLLVLSSCLMVGNYFSYDLPAALSIYL